MQSSAKEISPRSTKGAEDRTPTTTLSFQSFSLLRRDAHTSSVRRRCRRLPRRPFSRLAAFRNHSLDPADPPTPSERALIKAGAR